MNPIVPRGTHSELAMMVPSVPRGTLYEVMVLNIVPRGTNMYRCVQYVPRGTLEIFMKMKDDHISFSVICFNNAVIVNF